jgi:hypothetical protein
MTGLTVPVALALLLSQAPTAGSVSLVETMGRGYFIRCVTTLYLQPTDAYIVVKCEPNPPTLGEVYRLTRLSEEQTRTYTSWVSGADLLSGGHVSSSSLEQVDGLYQHLQVSLLTPPSTTSNAMLIVTDNATFSEGPRQRLVKLLEETRLRVFTEELPKLGKQK